MIGSEAHSVPLMLFTISLAENAPSSLIDSSNLAPAAFFQSHVYVFSVLPILVRVIHSPSPRLISILLESTKPSSIPLSNWKSIVKGVGKIVGSRSIRGLRTCQRSSSELLANVSSVLRFSTLLYNLLCGSLSLVLEATNASGRLRFSSFILLSSIPQTFLR